MAVRIETTPALTAGVPRVLFRGPYVLEGGGFGRTYDYARDGRFLLIKQPVASATERRHIIFVENWTEELKHLVPVN